MSLTIGETSVSKMLTTSLVEWCRGVCTDYQPQAKTLLIWAAILRAFDAIGTPMTVRQMFYALVARAIIEKTEQGYDQVGYHLLNMRRQQVIPYGFIADNMRYMRKPRTYASVGAFLQASQEFYRKAVWNELPARVEIWIEKDALAGVVYRVTERPYTVKELAEALNLDPKTVRKYLIAIAKFMDIHTEFPYKATTYAIKDRDR